MGDKIAHSAHLPIQWVAEDSMEGAPALWSGRFGHKPRTGQLPVNGAVTSH